MNTKDVQLADLSPAWYRHWFDADFYHQLYGNRNETEAAAFIDALLTELAPEPASIMLDLGCGKGRHSRHLAMKGFRVLGMDLSAASIRAAKKYNSHRLNFIRQDMREPFGNQCFDYVFNFFTSFGYLHPKRKIFR